MKASYLEVTFRHGRAFAAYLYLLRNAGDRSYRTARAEPGMIIDFDESGKAIGIEFTAPTKVTDADINRVLSDIGASPVAKDDMAPLQAA